MDGRAVVLGGGGVVGIAWETGVLKGLCDGGIDPAEADAAVLASVFAVDAHTGAMTMFDRSSGASLAEAVAASGAVAGLWPPVTIAGRRYIDGGSGRPPGPTLPRVVRKCSLSRPSAKLLKDRSP